MNPIQVLRRAGWLALAAFTFWLAIFVGGDDVPMREMLVGDPARALCAWVLAGLGMLFACFALRRP